MNIPERFDVFMLTLNRFNKLFRCFRCWLWTSKCRVGCYKGLNVSLQFHPSWHFLVQSQLWIHQNNVWNQMSLCCRLGTGVKETVEQVFIDNLEQVSHIVLLFSLLTLNKEMPTRRKSLRNLHLDSRTDSSFI